MPRTWLIVLCSISLLLSATEPFTTTSTMSTSEPWTTTTTTELSTSTTTTLPSTTTTTTQPTTTTTTTQHPTTTTTTEPTTSTTTTEPSTSTTTTLPSTTTTTTQPTTTTTTTEPSTSTTTTLPSTTTTTTTTTEPTTTTTTTEPSTSTTSTLPSTTTTTTQPTTTTTTTEPSTSTTTTLPSTTTTTTTTTEPTTTTTTTEPSTSTTSTLPSTTTTTTQPTTTTTTTEPSTSTTTTLPSTTTTTTTTTEPTTTTTTTEPSTSTTTTLPSTTTTTTQSTTTTTTTEPSTSTTTTLPSTTTTTTTSTEPTTTTTTTQPTTTTTTTEHPTTTTTTQPTTTTTKTDHPTTSTTTEPYSSPPSTSTASTLLLPNAISFKPNRGPIAGGTKLTISGNQFDLFPVKNVYVGNFLCVVDPSKQNESTNWTAVASTPPVNHSFIDKDLSVRVEFVDPSVRKITVSGAVFVYKNNPNIEDIRPTTLLEIGGTSVTVIGSDVDAVAQSLLRVSYAKYQDTQKMTKHFIGPCDDRNSSLLMCTSPKLEINSTDGWEVSPHSMSRGRQDDEDFDLYIGLLFDGYDEFANLSASNSSVAMELAERFRIVPQPSFKEYEGRDAIVFDPRKNETINIQGEGMENGCSIDDYSVLIGEGECELVDLTQNEVLCKPPLSEPKGANADGNLPLLVHIGQNIKHDIGFISYAKDESLITYIVSATVVLVVVCVVGLIICFCIQRKRDLHNRDGIGIDSQEFPVTPGRMRQTGLRGYTSVSSSTSALVNRPLSRLPTRTPGDDKRPGYDPHFGTISEGDAYRGDDRPYNGRQGSPVAHRESYRYGQTGPGPGKLPRTPYQDVDLAPEDYTDTSIHQGRDRKRVTAIFDGYDQIDEMLYQNSDVPSAYDETSLTGSYVPVSDLRAAYAPGKKVRPRYQNQISSEGQRPSVKLHSDRLGYAGRGMAKTNH